MDAGGVSSGWRVLGSVGDIRAVREKVLTLGLVQGWSSLPQGLVGICNVSFSFFSSSLNDLLLYWKCSLLKGSGLSFWRRRIALMRKWFISFWRLMILGGRLVCTIEILGCTWSLRVRWRLLMRSSISESLGEFSSFWVLGFCHVIWLIKCETLCRNAKPVEKLNDAYKKFMVRTMRRTKTVDDIRSFFCKFIYA